MNIVEIISSKLKSSYRWLKFYRYGRVDTMERRESLPYGVDSNPVKGTRAVFTTTSSAGQGVVIGYINTNQKADVGEFRTYATDSDGNEVFYTWMKNNGTMEIGGDQDNMVRYSELESAFNELKQDFNNHLINWNAFALAYVPGGPTAVGTPPTALDSQSSNADISGAKIDEIKTL